MAQLTGQSDSSSIHGGELAGVSGGLKRNHHEAPLHHRNLSDYGLLTKPMITIAVVATAYVGFAMGQKDFLPASASQWIALLGVLVGTTLSCIGSGVFNQIYERHTDVFMRRTKNRPLATGKIGVREGVALGVVLSLIGILILLLTTNLIAAMLSLITIIIYAAIYTPLKRVTSWSTAVGAVSGAVPPMIGYAAATGRVGLVAWLLFAIMFVWQFPHFFAISWVYRDQYKSAGLHMLSVVDPGGLRTFRQIIICCFALVPLSTLPTLFNLTGMIYFFVALVSSIVFLALAIVFMFVPTRKQARILFIGSLVYLPLVLCVMLINQIK